MECRHVLSRALKARKQEKASKVPEGPYTVRYRLQSKVRGPYGKFLQHKDKNKG
jgi:hypothetical protein